MSGLLYLGLFGLATAAPHSLRSLSEVGQRSLNGTSSAPFSNLSVNTAAAGSAWWYPNLDHTSAAVRDYAPFLSSDDYTTYIAVDAGDAAGFTNALYSGGPGGGDRDNMWIANEPRTVYLPPGTYTLNETVYLDTDTIIIGDAVNPPTIAASNGFDGSYLLVGGQGSGDGGGESHFSVMIKNVILDTTANSGSSDFAALSWRVAQNSALVNVQINLPQGAHTGLDIGQGSTIQVGDVTVRNGSTGVHWNTHQQATLKNFKLIGCTTGILIDSGNTLNIFAPTFDTVGRSIVFNSGAPWVSVIDATSKNSGDFFTSNVESPNFMLENINKDTTDSAMVTVNGNVKLDGSVQNVGQYVYGNTYGANPIYQDNPTNANLTRNKILAPNTAYPVISADQYTDATVDDVINLKDSNQNGGQTLKGDGGTDDGPALQAVLDYAAQQNKIGYLPYGIYLTQQTITIPSGTRLVGNGWSTISGNGTNFTNASKPTPVVQIGANPGDAGTCNIQDMRFTVADVLAGAVIVQINLAGANPGDVAIHNSLLTVGGTRDTKIDCNDESNCKAAYAGLVFAEGSSAYVDNFWAWVADHPSDGSSGGIRIAAKTGVVVESSKGTWLGGLGSEHFWLAQLAYSNSSANVFTSLFQSETNYHQGSSASVTPPGPWEPADYDPNFSWCDGDAECPIGTGQYWNGGSEYYSYASGSWNFQKYNGLQGNMNVINASPDGLHAYGLCDHETNYIMRLPDGTRFGQGDTDHFGGSWGTLVAAYTS